MEMMMNLGDVAIEEGGISWNMGMAGEERSWEDLGEERESESVECD